MNPYPTYTVLALLLALCILDRNFLAWFYLHVLRLYVAIRMVPMRIRLSIDIWRMKRNMKHYMDMAEQIRNQLDE